MNQNQGGMDVDFEYDGELDRRVNAAHQILSPIGFKRVCALESIEPSVIARFRSEVEAATNEKPMQKILWEHPQILARFLGPGHCWWIKQEVRLGNELRPDFMAARTESIFLNYRLVELESPTALWFNPSNGKPAEKMVEAVQQVAEWRHWIEKNQDYAQKPKPFGLGLANLTRHYMRSQIVIGRRKSVTDADRERLNAMKSVEAGYTVHTYDSVIERSKRFPVNDYGQEGDDLCVECHYIADDL